MTCYKVLNPDLTSRNGGPYQWVLGEWAPEIEGELVPCHNGYHVCEEGDLLEWLGPVICECEIGPEFVRAGNKTVARTARITRVLDTWNDRTARLFACDCAERVLPLFDSRLPDDNRPRVAIETARRFANGEATSKELAAAGAAARAASWAAGAASCAAARAASWAAARAASWAAGDAVRAASWAAGDAVRAASWAAGDAAGAALWATGAAAGAASIAAERQWQAQRLMEYLRGEAL